MPGGAGLRQKGQLVGASPSQQRPDEAIFGPEQEQQDTRAGADRGCQRPQRQVGQPVLESVKVGTLKEFIPAR